MTRIEHCRSTSATVEYLSASKKFQQPLGRGEVLDHQIGTGRSKRFGIKHPSRDRHRFGLSGFSALDIAGGVPDHDDPVGHRAVHGFELMAGHRDEFVAVLAVFCEGIATEDRAIDPSGLDLEPAGLLPISRE